MTNTVLTVSQKCELADAAMAAEYSADNWLITEDYDGRAISGLVKKGFAGITSNRKQFFVTVAGIEYVRSL